MKVEVSDFHGLPCWYELATNDLPGPQAFYRAVLGWQTTDSQMPGMTYLLSRADGAMVAGMMQAVASQPASWQIHYAVDKCDTMVDQAKAPGAQVFVPPSDIPDTGRFAVLADPQGAVFSILQPLPMQNDHSAKPFDPQLPGHGSWHELITSDPVVALDFYGKLFGWTVARSVPMGPEMTYHIIARAGVEIGGSCAFTGVPNHWKPYFGTASAKASLNAVNAAGGKVLHGPDKVPGGAFTVQIKDPQGAAFALVGAA